MQNKTIFITGANSGIGKATVEYFSKKGWNVCATMRDETKFELFANFKNVTCFKLDVTDIISIKKAITSSINKYKKIDVLVNNAGFGAVGIFENFTEEEVLKQFNTNVFGLMNVTKYFLPHFRKNNGALIINISSVVGKIAMPTYSLYSATKFAIEGFSQALQYELNQFNIKIKIIQPGPIKTDFHGRSQLNSRKSHIIEYEDYFKTVSKVTTKYSNKSQNPEVVAKKIYLACIQKNKRMNYPAGRFTGFYIFINKFIPDFIFRKVIRLIMERKEL